MGAGGAAVGVCGSERAQKFSKTFANFFEEIWNGLWRLAENFDRFLIAQHDELACILDDVETTAAGFVQKAVTTDKPFDIAHLAADNAALGSGFGAENLDDPAVGGDGGGQGCHPPTLPAKGKRRITSDSGGARKS